MLISIIIPVYNLENFVRDCINSVVTQSYSDIEIIIINDGSTDNSLCILQDLSAADTRIKIINIKNSGVSNARNLGIKCSSGKYICFIDGDDLVDKDYIKNLSTYCFREVDLVINGINIIDNLSNETEKVTAPINCDIGIYKDINLLNSVPLLCLASPISKLFKKSILVDNKLTFDNNLSIGEDYIFVMNYLYFSDVIAFSNNANYIYFRREGSLSTTYNNFEEELLAEKTIYDSSVLTLLKFGYSMNDLNPILIREFKKHAYRILFSLYKNKEMVYSRQQRLILLNKIDDQQFGRLQNMFADNGLKGIVISILINKRVFFFTDLFFKLILK